MGSTARVAEITLKERGFGRRMNGFNEPPMTTEKQPKVLAANVKAVAACTIPGRWHVKDEEGLYLQVTTATRRSWIFRYQFRGKPREDGLGSLKSVSLAEAIKKAKGMRHEIAQGRDPRGEAPDAPPVVSRTFREAAEAYIARKTPEWSNPKHIAQWPSSLATHAYPTIGDRSCHEITVNEVVALLTPIWKEKTETAKKVQGRIKEVLDAEFVLSGKSWPGWNNPAVWQGNLKHILPKPSKIREVKKHKAVDWQEAPDAYAKIAAGTGAGALALRFVILTAARSQMGREAFWPEVDLDAGLWRVPAKRVLPDGRKVGSGTKGVEHTCPLADAATAILAQAANMRRPDSFVFPGAKPGSAMSDMTMLMACYRAEVDATVHGWRSTFSTWSAEWLLGDREETEVALCHEIPGTRGDYMRGALLEHRRLMMQAWAAFLSGTPDEAEAARTAYRDFAPKAARAKARAA